MVVPQSHTREKQQVMRLFKRTANDGVSIMILFLYIQLYKNIIKSICVGKLMVWFSNAACLTHLRNSSALSAADISVTVPLGIYINDKYSYIFIIHHSTNKENV